MGRQAKKEPIKKAKKPVIKKKEAYTAITISHDYMLFDWSETLTYDEIDSTLYIIGLYYSNNSIFEPEVSLQIQKWLKNNDLNKFIIARDRAEAEQISLEIEEEKVRELMTFPVRRKYLNN